MKFNRKYLIAVAAIATLSFGVFTGCSSKKEEAKTEASETLTLKDGTYTKKDETPDESGYLCEMTMVVEGGKITSVTYDKLTEDGKSTAQMAKDGEYVMTEDGLTWDKQIDALIANFVENQNIDKITVNDEGKTDAVSGVSINVQGFIAFAQDCLGQASK